MKEDNDDIDRIIECNKCGKVFKYNYLLIKHENNKNLCNKPEKINKYFNTKITDIDNKINEYDKLSIDSKKKCYYCNNPVLVLYEYVREPRQWTVERIDNKL